MKNYKLNPMNFDKFVHQNKGDLVDFYEGCLLDNYLFQTQRGMMAIYESYVNPNMSEYLVVFASDKEEINRLWDEFTDNRNQVEEIA